MHRRRAIRLLTASALATATMLAPAWAAPRRPARRGAPCRAGRPLAAAARGRAEKAAAGSTADLPAAPPALEQRRPPALRPGRPRTGLGAPLIPAPTRELRRPRQHRRAPPRRPGRRRRAEPLRRDEQPLVRDLRQDRRAPLYGPAANNTLWAGFGGACEAENRGQPIVVYDQFADRWLLSADHRAGPTCYVCVALSATGDPTGSYYRWAFSTGDEPPRPAQATASGATPTTSTPASATARASSGVGAYALDRAEMLAGESAPQVVSFLMLAGDAAPTSATACCPPTSTARRLPPAGAPAILLGTLDDGAVLRCGPGRAHDLALPRRLRDPGGLELLASPPRCRMSAPFDTLFASGCTAAFPQPGTGDAARHRSPTGSGRMHRARLPQLRRPRGAGRQPDGRRRGRAWPASAGGRCATRTARRRSSRRGPTCPGATDGIHRWIGSAAMDVEGNLALGYSASSGDALPERLLHRTPGRRRPRHAAAGRGRHPRRHRLPDRQQPLGHLLVDDRRRRRRLLVLVRQRVPARDRHQLAAAHRLLPVHRVRPARLHARRHPVGAGDLRRRAGHVRRRPGRAARLRERGDARGRRAAGGHHGRLHPDRGDAARREHADPLRHRRRARRELPARDLGHGGGRHPLGQRRAARSTRRSPPARRSIAPADGATDQAIAPTLSWSAVAGASGYLVEVDDSLDFASPEFSSSQISTSVVATGLVPLHRYFWRVTAENACGDAASATFDFTTAALFCRAPGVAIPDPNPVAERRRPAHDRRRTAPSLDLDVTIKIDHTWVGDLKVHAQPRRGAGHPDQPARLHRQRLRLRQAATSTCGSTTRAPTATSRRPATRRRRRSRATGSAAIRPSTTLLAAFDGQLARRHLDAQRRRPLGRRRRHADRVVPDPDRRPDALRRRLRVRRLQPLEQLRPGPLISAPSPKRKKPRRLAGLLVQQERRSDRRRESHCRDAANRFPRGQLDRRERWWRRWESNPRPRNASR